MASSLIVRLPVDEYRSHPIPFVNQDSSRPKVGSCYVAVEALPTELRDWLEVNPRAPSLKKGSDELKGPVATAIVETLMEKPDMMALMNNGITILVEKAEHVKSAGGKGELTLTLSDKAQHGVPNGAHTLSAIFQTSEDPDRPDPWNAMVRLHIFEGLEKDVIPAMAEGLNRSLQVDDKSLENLRGLFDKIKNQMDGKAGHDQIAYFQGDPKPVDVQYLLSLMVALNLTVFPDRKTHPNTYFGQTGKVLDKFAEDQTGPTPVQSFDIMLPKLQEILKLADEVQRRGVKLLPRLKVKTANAKNTGRVASVAHKQREAYFAGGQIDGFFPVGWLFPMISAFRANISKSDWDNGLFKWIRDPMVVLDATIDEMCDIIKEEHISNKEKPAEVGKKPAAYRLCYGVLAQEVSI
ncbi:AIPR family protein [Rhodoferax bucti]|uniref:AIPR family protein n=1 Tax=Rhodoferax bucti TaxID=2576305 RepID=UPI0011098977|nr:AIPR family protein [Rhodoferax bucti]